MPEFMSVTLSGITKCGAGTVGCNGIDCDSANGTWTLEHNCNGIAPCEWCLDEGSQAAVVRLQGNTIDVTSGFGGLGCFNGEDVVEISDISGCKLCDELPISGVANQADCLGGTALFTCFGQGGTASVSIL